MPFLFRLFFGMLLVPLFVVFLLISIPVMLLLTCMASKVRVNTVKMTGQPNYEEATDKPLSSEDSVYDVDCTVIQSTVVEEKQEKLNEGK